MLILRYKYIGGDNLESMGDRIKRLRIEANLTQEELGKKVGLKRAAINKYEKGNVENMKRSVVEKMSFIFNVSPSYLMALDNNLTENIPNITTIYSELNQLRQNKVYNYAEQQLTEQKQEQQSNVVPFNSSNDDQLTSFDWCGYVSAGTGEFLDGNERKSIIQLPKSDIPQNADFAVTVNGDSMKPVFKNHETIFVEKTTDLSSGSIGIVVVEGEAFVKKIYIHDDCITLVSLNPTYKDKVIKDAQSIKVIGRVII